MHNPIERENEIMDVLGSFSNEKLDFVVVGGYAVSAFRHRFSIDADIVIRESDREIFENILRKRGYKKTVSKVLKNVYSSEFLRYEKDSPKVSVDMLIGGVGVRQTGAFFGFDLISSSSEIRTVEGMERAVKVRVPAREMQIVMKLHSGRLTDLRDVAALSFDLDIEMIRKHLFRGKVSVVRKTIEKLGVLVKDPQFIDSFKGVFMEKGYVIDVKSLRGLVFLKDDKRKA